MFASAMTLALVVEASLAILLPDNARQATDWRRIRRCHDTKIVVHQRYAAESLSLVNLEACGVLSISSIHSAKGVWVE